MLFLKEAIAQWGRTGPQNGCQDPLRNPPNESGHLTTGTPNPSMGRASVSNNMEAPIAVFGSQTLNDIDINKNWLKDVEGNFLRHLPQKYPTDLP